MSENKNQKKSPDGELNTNSPEELFNSLSRILSKKQQQATFIAIVAAVFFVGCLVLIVITAQMGGIKFLHSLNEAAKDNVGKIIAAVFSAFVLRIELIQANENKMRLLDALKKQKGYITDDSLRGKYIDLLTELVKKETFT